MNFLAPGMFAGLLAVGAPILIHLLSRRRPRPLPWGAMRFLLEAARRNRRHLRVAELLLLLARCATVALLALAFTRPVWDPGPARGAAGGPLTAVLVADATASLLATDGVHTRWDRALEAADAWLGSLPDGSAVALLLATDPVRPLIAEPTTDLALVRRTLGRAAPDARSASLRPALERAATLLAGVTGATTIAILTDGQPAAWAGLDQPLPGRPPPPVRLLDFAPPEAPNLALTGLEVSPAFATAGTILRLRGTVANYGPLPATGVRLTAALGDAPPAAETVLPAIPPGGTVEATLGLRAPAASLQPVTLALPADTGPWDNTRSAVVPVLERFDVLLAEGPETRPGLPPGFFLGHALAAALPAESGAPPLLRLTRLPAARLATVDVGGVRLAFLANVTAPDEAAALDLAAWVRRGGHLVLFPGPATDAAATNAVLARHGLLPATLGETRTAPRGSPFALGPPEYRHPLVTPWNEPAFGRLDTVRLQSAFALDPAGASVDPADPAAVPRPVLPLLGGPPAAVELPVGAGRVLLFAFPADASWSDLPLRPAFVPLVHRIVLQSAEGAGRGFTLPAGQAARHPLPAAFEGRPWTATLPDGSTVSGRAEAAPGGAALVHRATTLPGIHRLRLDPLPGAPATVGDDAVFAINPDPAESDLRPAPAPPLLAAALADAGGDPAAGAGSASRRTHANLQLWTPLVVLVILLVAVESWYARRCSDPR